MYRSVFTVFVSLIVFFLFLSVGEANDVNFGINDKGIITLTFNDGATKTMPDLLNTFHNVCKADIQQSAYNEVMKDFGNILSNPYGGSTGSAPNPEDIVDN